jgi:DHA3 family tetracycline resistance protein-like MFS transporter
MQKLNARTIWYLVAALWAFFNSIAFSVTGIYYVNEVGLNPLQLILLGTAMETAAFLFEIPTGVVADVYSRRASVIVGVFLSGLAMVQRGAEPPCATVAAGAFLFGFAATYLSGAIDAWLADEIGAENLGPAYFRATQLGYAGSLAGIGVGVGLATFWLSLPIVLGGAATAGFGLFLLLFMPETGFRAAAREGRGSWGAMASTLAAGATQVRTKPILIGLLAVAAVMGMYSEGVDRLSEPHFLKNFNFPELGGLQPVVWLGGIRAMALVLGIAGTALARRLVDPSQARQASAALITITAIEIVGTLAFALSGHFALAVASIWLAGVARSSAGPIYRTWLNQSLDSRSRATVLSMSSQMDAFGQIAGGPAVGAIGNSYSLRAALATSGLILSPALWIYRRVRMRIQSDDEAHTA